MPTSSTLNRSPSPPSWRSALGIGALACVLALAVGLPALRGEGALGQRYVDGLGSWWFQWWVDHALAEGLPLLHTDVIFYPWGKDILRDTGANLVDALLALPLRRLAGPLFAWNGLVLGVLATNGLAAGLWARLRGHSTIAALAATAVATTSSFVLFELSEGRPTQALLAPLVATLALAEAAMTSPSSRRGLALAAAAGACLALTGWVYWYAALFTGLAVLLLWPGRGMAARTARLVVLGAVTAALTAPVAVPLTQALLNGQVGAVVPLDRWLAGDFVLRNALGDPLSMCVLGAGGSADHVNQWGTRSGGMSVDVTIVLACLASAAAGRRWPAIALIGIGIAVGPFPGGAGNPLYLGLTALIPPMERLYWPCRAVALLVPVSVIGVASVVDLARRLAARSGKPWVVAAAVGATLALPAAAVAEGHGRGLWPLPTWDPTVSPVWSCMAELEGAIIVLPYGLDHENLLLQTVHEQPQLGGMNERSSSQVPQQMLDLKEENSWLVALFKAYPNPRDQSPWTEEDRQAIHDLGYEWLAVRVAPMTDPKKGSGTYLRERAARFRMEALAGPVVWRDESTWLYAPWGAPFRCAAPP